ncbi:MAG: quinone oxidoreductase [Proteobacteria bacterium]|jgi:NADPH2:quinone reductase|nr:quinone oxidoreductase [Candidatus Fonsibacter sp. PEL4]
MVKAIRITETGKPNVMKFVDVDLKKLAPNEVLIKNKAVGLNYIDVYHRSGTYPLPLPNGIGLEAAGVIEEIGSDVKEFKVGDRVAHAAAPPGSYSEKQVYPQEKIVKIPDYISDEIASCIMLKGITSEYLIHRAYAVKKGEFILFHAAAGGVGQVLCQWAKSLGCKVIGTVGSDEKIAIAKENGCDFVINYSKESFSQKVKEITEGKMLKVVYDGVGAKTFEESLDCLAIRGTMVSFGNASGLIDKVDPKKHIAPKGLYFTRPSIAHYTVTREELVNSANTVFEAIKTNKFKIKIFKKFALKDAVTAHEELEARKLTGPAILVP